MMQIVIGFGGVIRYNVEAAGPHLSFFDLPRREVLCLMVCFNPFT